MKYILVLLLLALLGTVLSRNKKIITKQLPAQGVILAFGDSLTYGFGADPGQSYPTILSQLSGHRVVNEGINGETSADGLRRLPDILQESQAEIMILCFGGNDILQGKSREALHDNLVEMIIMAKRKNMQVLLISVPDISLMGLSTLSLYQEIADQEKIPYVDTMLEDILSDNSLKNDRVHPNAVGYQKMAEEIYQALLKYKIL